MSKKEFKYIISGLLIFGAIACLLLSFVYSFSSANSITERFDGLEVVIDSDPGADDAMAILMMLSTKSKANVLAITITSGNTGAQNGTQNALLILNVANRTDVPVFSGSNQGLAYFEKSDNFFGYDGLGDIFTNKPEISEKKHAALALADIVRQKPGRITVLVTGPLTNIALALHIYPNFLADLKDIIILGGSYQGGGNKKPGVEFNIYADPEAAAFVFSKVKSDKPIILVPLETVRQEAIPLNWRRNVLGNLGNCYMDFLNRAENVSLSKQKIWYPFDQTAAAVILEPAVVFEKKDVFIRVETCGILARGAFFRDDKSTVVNARVVTCINATLLQETLLNYLNSSGVCV